MKILKVVTIVFALFMVSQISAQQTEKQAKNKFKRINTDKDEFITVKEWEDFYKGKTNKKGKAFKSDFMFLGIDRNDDKKISLEEMIKGIDRDLAKSRTKILKKEKKQKSKN